MVFQFRSMANGSSYNILQRIDCRSKGVDSREAPMRAMPRASILSVLRQSGEHPETRFVRRLSFIQLLHQVARRRKPPQIRFFRSLPGTKGIQSYRVLLPCGDKAHDWPSPAARGKLLRPCGQPQCRCPCRHRCLPLLRICIGSWLTEHKCRGNGRSAGGGAALGSPACCDNRARDALGRKPLCSRATDRRGAAANHHLQF